MKNKLLLLMLLFATVFVSCNKSHEEGVGKKQGTFTLTCNVPGVNINTKATMPSQAGEDQINTLYILFFHSTSDGSGAFIESYNASPSSGTLSSGQAVEIAFPVGSSLNATTAYDMLIVANIESYVTSVTLWLGTFTSSTTYQQAINTFMVTAHAAAVPSDDSQAISPSHLLMSAQITKEAAQTSVSTNLIRSLARLDVDCTQLPANYTLVSASIWNAYPTATIWQSSFSNFSASRLQRYYGVSASANQIKGGLYCFENYVTEPHAGDNQTTCLILGINNGSATSYYRVNITNTYGQFLKSNYAYKLSVYSVSSAGAATEAGAYTSTNTSLGFMINQWVLDNSGNIQFDGDNILAIPTLNINFTPAGDGGEPYLYNIFAQGEGTLAISKTSLPAGITATLSGTLLTVTAAPSANNLSGFVELTFGSLKAVINITQTGSNAQYLNLSTTSVPEFTMFANQGTATPITVSSSGPWTATIFNGNFSFASGATKTTLTGNNGDSFNLYTINPNSTTSPAYAFVAVTLNADNDHTGALVLTQQAAPAVTLSPSQSSITFDPNGSVIGNAAFTVSDGGYPFSYSFTGANPLAFNANISGNTITVSTAGVNGSGTAYNATLNVFITGNPGAVATIPVTQATHTISVNPTALSAPYTAGASSNITVTSSGPWTATITSALSNGKTATLTTLNGVSGGTTAVNMPVNYSGTTMPVMTITFSVTNAPTVTATTTVTQASFVAPSLSVVSYSSGSGTLTPTDSFNSYVAQLNTLMLNTSSFGPTGTVYCQLYNGKFSDNNSPTGANIFMATSASAYVPTNINAINSWRTASPNNVLMICYDNVTNQATSLTPSYFPQLSLTQDIYPFNNRPYMLAPGLSSTTLGQYLLNGPFGSVNTNLQISIGSTTVLTQRMTTWPGTVVPILVSAAHSGYVYLAVDPTNRIIFFGDTAIWSPSYTVSGTGVTTNDYQKLMNNLIAWMTNTAIYGSVFNNPPAAYPITIK